MMCGLAVLGVFIGALSYAGTEILLLIQRNKKHDKAIEKARKHAIVRLTQGQSMFYAPVNGRDSALDLF